MVEVIVGVDHVGDVVPLERLLDGCPVPGGQTGSDAGVAELAGFGFETLADAQLAAFRKHPENSGKVLDSGERRVRHGDGQHQEIQYVQMKININKKNKGWILFGKGFNTKPH